MSFTDAEKVDVRRYCGYPAYGAGASGFQGWRFFQAYGLMEYRLNNMAPDEETQTRTYLTQLDALEVAIFNASTNLGTASAAVWTRNSKEVQERTNLLDQWRRKLCGFIGVPPGPDLENGGGNSMRVVV